jgi:tetratricopeptide (TPR) repeat protein
MDRIGAALAAGELAQADLLLRSRLVEVPDDINAIATLAELAAGQGKTADAAALLHTALALAPAADALRLRLAQLHRQQGHFAAALSQIELLPEPLRRSSEVMVEEAGLAGQLGRRKEEVALYEDLLRQRPRDIRLWIGLANALNYLGRPLEAAQALRQAIKIRPSSGETWWSLANLKSYRFDDRDIAAMQRTLRRSNAAEDALHLHFALGSAFEGRADYRRSFDHYAAGNRLRARDLQPGQLSVTGFVNAAIAAFREPLFERFRGAGCMTSEPIFIVGLQRSGSTLLEQILSSHPQIEGASELLALQQVWASVEREAAAKYRTPFAQLAALEPSQIRALGEDYLERTLPFRPLGRRFFVDKLPANWLNTGLIRLALPNARIIDARRHPMACGFSNFKQLYAAGVTYSYGLESIGTFYADYLRFMRHIDQVQPGSVHHVIYDRLVEEPEAEVQRLLDFIGVPFEPVCLKFHKNRRAVPTPSAEQVRRPINRAARDAWHPYEPWLDPLRRALGPALNEWEAAT